MGTATKLPDVFTSVRPDEAQRLAEIATGRWLEVGSWVGFSTIVLAQHADEVWAVDWHRGDDHAGRQDTLPQLWKNLERYGVRDRVTILVGDADRVLPLLAPDTFDGAFVDGFHSVEAATRNLLDVIPLVKHNGLIAVHDYGDERFGVTEAVGNLIDTNGDRLDWHSCTTTLAVLRRL